MTTYTEPLYIPYNEFGPQSLARLDVNTPLIGITDVPQPNNGLIRKEREAFFNDLQIKADLDMSDISPSIGWMSDKGRGWHTDGNPDLSLRYNFWTTNNGFATLFAAQVVVEIPNTVPFQEFCALNNVDVDAYRFGFEATSKKIKNGIDGLQDPKKPIIGPIARAYSFSPETVYVWREQRGIGDTAHAVLGFAGRMSYYGYRRAKTQEAK